MTGALLPSVVCSAGMPKLTASLSCSSQGGLQLSQLVKLGTVLA